MKRYKLYVSTIFIFCLPSFTGSMQEDADEEASASADAVQRVPDINALFQQINDNALMYLRGTVGYYVGCGLCQKWQNLRAKVSPSKEKEYADKREQEYQKIIAITQDKRMNYIEKITRILQCLRTMKADHNFKDDSFYKAFRSQTNELLRECKEYLATTKAFSPEALDGLFELMHP